MGFLAPLERSKQRRQQKSFKKQIVDGAKYLPLIAAIFAPLSILFEIAGTTEPWFNLMRHGDNVADERGSLVLSGISLAVNVFANAALAARFTVSDIWWKKTMHLSVFFWCIKIVLATCNLGYYGTRSHDPGTNYTEGFWCAVLSCIIAGLVAIMLIMHWLLRRNVSTDSGAEIRVAGARFQLSVIIFLSSIAIQGLIFSRVENWTFSEGIYYSEVTAFTIGFGDYEPTHTSTRILNFPFAVLNISLLAVMLGQLVGFIQVRASKKRGEYREIFEADFEKCRAKESDPALRLSLVKEIAELRKMERLHERFQNFTDMMMSTVALVIFWLVGAAIFNAMEGFGFGNSLYFCYIFFLTIGYGDLYPVTAAGRMFFILFAFAAVPVVTNFVLTTVTGVLEEIADRVGEHAREKRDPEKSELKLYHTHAYNISQMQKRLLNQSNNKRNPLDASDAGSMAQLVIGLAIRLEAQSRAIMIETLERGSKAQLLLRADQSLQRRVMRELHEKHTRKQPTMSELLAFDICEDSEIERDRIAEQQKNDYRWPEDTFAGDDPLEEVRKYRQTFAALLAVSTQLLKLEGEDRLIFQRRLERDEEYDKGGILLGANREGPAEKALGVDV